MKRRVGHFKCLSPFYGCSSIGDPTLGSPSPFNVTSSVWGSGTDRLSWCTPTVGKCDWNSKSLQHKCPGNSKKRVTSHGSLPCRPCFKLSLRQIFALALTFFLPLLSSHSPSYSFIVTGFESISCFY